MTSIKCKWCNSLTVRGIPPSQIKEFDRWLCTGCGAIGYIQDPSAEELSEIYKKAWKDANDSGRFAAGSTNVKIANSLLAAFCGSTVHGSCLEYGGGNGKFSEALLDHKATDIFVYEPYGFCQKTHGIRWFSAWENLPKDKKFDWIFMVEVIEHLLDPVGELSKIRKKLSPSGKLAITTPNARGWRSIREGVSWREAKNPTHINLFSPAALKTCLRRSGFKRIKRLYRPVHYNKNKLFNCILGVMQVFGTDGGIRILSLNT